MTFRVASLCAGYGGLELALRLAGVDHELVWWAEIDKHAATVMESHTDTPNLGDICAIRECPPVDLVTAGWPCQPVSVAGARLGVDDARWLIRDVVAVWRASGARWLFLENVWGLLTANDGQAFGEVLDALAAVGAAARWTCVRASDVGAPHRRTRWFCLATNPDSTPRGPLGNAEPRDSTASPPRRGATQLGRRCCTPTDTHSGTGRLQPVGLTGGGDPMVSGPHRQASEWGPYSGAIHRWELAIGRAVPAPLVDGQLNARLVEWMMGLPKGWVTDCGLPRTQALRVLGNGVVPQQAAMALRMLTSEGSL